MQFFKVAVLLGLLHGVVGTPAAPISVESCPWVNATSDETGMLVCFDGVRCSLLSDGAECCNCHGGRAICPPEDPLMCADKTCASDSDHCCSFTCEAHGGVRSCPPTPTGLPIGGCEAASPSPPHFPPSPPWSYVFEWQQFFTLLLPAGRTCRWADLTLGLDYVVLTEWSSDAACANHCLRTPSCTGFEAPATQRYCSLWFRGACSNASAPYAYQRPATGNASILEYVRLMNPPPSPPAAPPLPEACSASCQTKGGSTVHCAFLASMTCADAQLFTRALDCTACDGCCISSPPSPPPSPSPLPLPPPPTPPPPPAFPDDSCPWLHTSSGEANMLVCHDGTRCSVVNGHYDCCDCHGGRALCPLFSDRMCAYKGCGNPSSPDYCCQASCEGAGGIRPCPSAQAGLQRCSMLASPPPPTPPQLPYPPSAPYDFVWQESFHILNPPGSWCDYTKYRLGSDYAVYAGHITASECANRCLNDVGCTGIEVPGEHQHCVLWYHGACSDVADAGAIEGRAVQHGPATGPDSLLEYVRYMHPPPLPPPFTPPPSPPASPPPPDTCASTCQARGGSTVKCAFLLPLPCDDADRVMHTLNCTACDGCCTYFPPAPPPLPPSPPPPSQPPPPAFPDSSCPWKNASSGEENVVVCFDGTRCNWLNGGEGVGCCDCHGGRAICPLGAPFMCASTACAQGLDHCCDPSPCKKLAGIRMCPSDRIKRPSSCDPPPVPPQPPPAPPSLPWPPVPPYSFDWMLKFTALEPIGTTCYWSDFTSGVDYILYGDQMDTAHCANRCLRSRHGCTGIEAPGDSSYCLLWLNGACSRVLVDDTYFSASEGDGSYVTYVKLAAPIPLVYWVPFVAIGSLVAVALLVWIMVRSVRRKPPDALLRNMSVRLEGATEPVDLRSYLEEAMRSSGLTLSNPASPVKSRRATSPGKMTEPASPPASDDSKFVANLKELTFGTRAKSTLGVMDHMRVRAEDLHGSDVADIEAEFTAAVASARAACDEANSGAEEATIPAWAADVKLAEAALECCQYCVHQRAGASVLTFPNSRYPRDHDASGVLDSRKDAAGLGMTLDDFCELPEARTAHLTRAHVVALRIYSTAAFKLINDPLRERWCERPHPLPVTVYFLTHAISKLRTVDAEHETASQAVDLWRGVKDRKVSSDFATKGGSDFAPLSTTGNLETAVQYSDGTHSLLFKLRADDAMLRGASIEFLSAFPGEKEYLFPPLTFLKPSGKQEEFECSNGRKFTVLEVKPIPASA